MYVVPGEGSRKKANKNLVKRMTEVRSCCLKVHDFFLVISTLIIYIIYNVILTGGHT